jgi:acyl-coenzyme A synthetase/AMP-(fatty) acid ligase
MSLRGAIEAQRASGSRWLYGRDAKRALPDCLDETVLPGGAEALRGKSVMIYTDTQLAAAAALIELDGVASRILICPPDIKPDYIASLAEQAEIDAIVTCAGRATAYAFADNIVMQEQRPIASRVADSVETEWLLLTSGTTGIPKIVRHTFLSLTGAIKPDQAASVWSTFYDIRRYGGLQIFLRAVLGAGSLVLSDAHETVTEFLVRLARHKVTHISGTPSHWRRVLMTPEPQTITPRYVRLSGEIADQRTLDGLREAYPEASIAHAYASTEAGVGFVVEDGLEGFPAAFLENCGDVKLAVKDHTLRLKSVRGATRYVGNDAALVDDEGFIDSGDIVEKRGDRYYFMGRTGGIINVGGLKVHPEEVEAVINRDPRVRMSLVKPRANPFTGSIIVADVVLNGSMDEAAMRADILAGCRATLPQHKVPALVRFVPSLELGASGKLVRHHA